LVFFSFICIFAREQTKKTMAIVIGIDVGISTTKIVGLREGRVVSPIRITAADQVTSLYGAFGKYLHDNKIELKDVEQVMVTGVGASYVNEPIYGIPTQKVDEFIADGLGARFESGLTKAIVVSMGTGTSFVQCDGDEVKHIGGIGIGGGTLQGLSRVMLNTRDPKQIQSLAMQGNIRNINLLIGDISTHPLPGLPMDATASLFSKAQYDAPKEDVALGIITLVLQCIGSAAILAALNSGIKDFVLIGNLTLLPQCKEIYPMLEKLYNVHFHIPKYAEFCTAIGAALNYKK
jgi:type II pantothenate kinase